MANKKEITVNDEQNVNDEQYFEGMLVVHYQEQRFEFDGPLVLDYLADMVVKTIESRQGKADDDTRPARVVEVLRNLEQGILPSRGSKGSTREPWEGERTVILKSMLNSAGIEHSLKGDENINAAIAKLASAHKRDESEFADMLNKRAMERYTLLNAPL